MAVGHVHELGQSLYMNPQGEKEELDWFHVQAPFGILAASEEIQGSESDYVIRCPGRQQFYSAVHVH